MLFVDLARFVVMVFIANVVLRFAAVKLADTRLGPALAFAC